MTREEKEQTGKYVLQIARLLEDGCYQQEMLLKAVHIIDEALEQEHVIDKIRAEIESYKLSEDELSDMDEDSIKWGMKIAYDIVDKYKAESEDKE